MALVCHYFYLNPICPMRSVSFLSVLQLRKLRLSRVYVTHGVNDRTWGCLRKVIYQCVWDGWRWVASDPEETSVIVRTWYLAVWIDSAVEIWDLIKQGVEASCWVGVLVAGVGGEILRCVAKVWTSWFLTHSPLEYGSCLYLHEHLSALTRGMENGEGSILGSIGKN